MYVTNRVGIEISLILIFDYLFPFRWQLLVFLRNGSSGGCLQEEGMNYI